MVLTCVIFEIMAEKPRFTVFKKILLRKTLGKIFDTQINKYWKLHNEILHRHFQRSDESES